MQLVIICGHRYDVFKKRLRMIALFLFRIVMVGYNV